MEKNFQFTFHEWLASDEKGPGEYFDLVTCIPSMEHVYDNAVLVDPTRPFPHLEGIRVMLRMLNPGGLLALTYDFF